MLRPNPCLTNPAFLQPSTVNTTSAVGGSVSPEILDAVFRSVNNLGIDTIYNQCEQRREGKLSDSAIQQMDFGEYANINWLLALSHDGLIEVQNSVQGIRSNIPGIVGALKFLITRDSEVFVYQSTVSPTCSYQIVAQYGCIYRRDAQGEKILLMTFSQFLSKAKPSWQPTWNLAGLDLSDLDLSDVNLDFANLEGTNLTGTNLCNTSMVGANLKNAELTYARVEGTNFSRSNLTEALCQTQYLNGIVIDTAFVQEPKLANASLQFTILTALFDLCCENGVDKVVRMCQDKLDNRPSWFNDGYNHVNHLDSYQLATLNDEELRMAQQIAQGLQKKVPDIVGVFHVDANRQQQIVVYPPIPSETDLFQIIAKAGCLYLKNKGDPGIGTQLMAAGQFFSYGLAPGEDRIWNLAGMDLSNLDLSGAVFEKADLSGANLSRTNLTDANMKNANLSSTNLKEARFDNTRLQRANLHKADMRWTTLIGTKFTTANLSEANFLEADISNVYFTSANLRGTNFTGATMCDICLHNTQFDCATKWQNTSITLNYRSNITWDEMFNHLTNTENGSLLTRINSMDEQYLNKDGKQVKLDLMHQAIESIEKYVDEEVIHDFAEALMDIFTNNPLYLNDPLIRTFIKENILPARVKHANSAELTIYTSSELPLLIEFIQSNEQPAEIMLNNNNFFLQLMLLCTQKEREPDLQKQAQQLYKQYLSLEQLQGVEELIEDVAGGDIRLIDGLEKHMTTGAELPAGACFAFFQNVENTRHVLILDRTQVRALQRADSSDAECRYDALCYAKGPAQQALALVPTGEQSLPDILNVFPLFKSAYEFKLNGATFVQLLNTINLKYDNKNHDPDYLSKDYTPLFLQALSSVQTTVKLCGAQDQLTLTAIFSPLLVAHPFAIETYLESVNITDIHYADLMSVYGLSTATHVTKAQTLFCLAAVFAKYSSSFIFGGETESPQALRAYAAALMVKAYELDPSIFANGRLTAEDNFTDLMQKMLGGKDANGRAIFTCSAVASGEMLRHTQQEEGFNAIAAKIKPPGW